MRQIKFRAWHKKEKTMVFLDTFEDRIEFSKDGTWKFMRWSESEDQMERLTSKQGILMQSIGLKDKNGKEIFDGDVVKPISTAYGMYHYIVKWAQDPCGFKLDGCQEMECFGQYEVIGNIYENPELLTKA